MELSHTTINPEWGCTKCQVLFQRNLKHAENVLNQFAEDITDKVFLMIQNDKELMKDYLGFLDTEKKNSITLKELNRSLGSSIKKGLTLGIQLKAKNQKVL